MAQAAEPPAGIDLSSRAEALDTGEPDTPPTSFSRIDLQELDANLFFAPTEKLWLPIGSRGIYGGQVVGQALVAAARTVSGEFQLHSLHSYFLRAGEATHPVIYSVVRTRDGSSFCSRVVTAQQRGRAIFMLQASFHRAEPSRLDHQATMPAVPPPEDLPSAEARYRMAAADPAVPKDLLPIIAVRLLQTPLDVRYVTPVNHLHAIPQLTKDSYTQMVWMKTKARLPDDPQLHHAVVAYASDHFLVGTACGEHSWTDLAMVASLDHAMWFHAPVRADEWLLLETTSHRAGSGRGLTFGRFYRQDGTLAISVAQEGVFRLRGDASKL